MLTDAGRRGGRPLHARCHRNALSLKHRLIITDARPFSLSLSLPLPGRHLYTLSALPGHRPGSTSTAILPSALRNPSFSYQSLLFPTSVRSRFGSPSSLSLYVCVCVCRRVCTRGCLRPVVTCVDDEGGEFLRPPYASWHRCCCRGATVSTSRIRLGNDNVARPSLRLSRHFQGDRAPIGCVFDNTREPPTAGERSRRGTRITLVL